MNAIKRQVAGLRGTVAQERRRVEGLFAEDRGWDMGEWRRYYLGHPITGRIALDEVPRLVFTEAMRDVDLFVGVASIALDPNWADRGGDPNYAYWERASFGELTAIAEVRRDALARIRPKLAIAGQLELGDRYVLAWGKRASYRIHLGSANVLIEPGNRYLCVVPATGRTRRVMVPFEGDAVLSLVLSKIVLLAADDRITDPMILSQLP